MPTTTTYNLPYPLPSDPADVASDVEALARATEDAIAAVEAAPVHIVPTGTIVSFISATPPSGWLLCNGGEASASAYPALATLIGTTFDAAFGAPSTGMFRLPNLSSRVPLGVDTGYALGSIGGASTVALSATHIPSHRHTIGAVDINHTHSGATGGASTDHAHGLPQIVTTNAGGTAGLVYQGSRQAAGGLATGGHSVDHAHGFTTGWMNQNNVHDHGGYTGYQGDGTAHANVQPYLALHFIIKT